MERRIYYSVRTGRHSDGVRYDLATLKSLFLAVYEDFLERERFQELLGKDCVDDPDTTGAAGRNVAVFFLRKLRKDGLWPIQAKIDSYVEDDLFDVIELLYDHVSVGLEGYYHSFSGCGMHFSSFDPVAGRKEFRDAINELLTDYAAGFELSPDGEIMQLPEVGFDNLLNADLPHPDQHNVRDRIDAAVRKYRSRLSSLQDRKEAVRGLVDVLEYLRPQVKDVFATKDEADLFNIANNFGLRHHNDRQRTDYDPNIWTSWMFYFYLATIHTALRLLDRHSPESSAE